MANVADILEEILELLRDRGEVTKHEVMESWGIGEEEYEFFRTRILKSPGVTRGNRKRGGFVLASRRRDDLPPERRGDACQLRTGWEEASVSRLCELLQHRQLEELLGNLVHTIREYRRHRTGESRRGTKTELATALVVQHGTGLLGQPDIRRAIGRAARVHAPGRWHSGKGAALAFAHDAGFPIEMAGLPSSETRPDFELLEGRIELKKLRPFQEEVRRKLLNRLIRPGDRALVSLPTGAGKTRVAVQSLRYWLLDRFDQHVGIARQGLAIWLAHTEELCEQAYMCFRQIWESDVQRSPLLLVRFWGQHTRKHETVEEILHQSQILPSVLISTPQRMVNMIRGTTDNGLNTFLDIAASTGLVVIDEAHRAAARSYREILDQLTDLDRRISVVGLTATPFRMEYLQDDPEAGTRELRDLFHTLIEADENLGSNPRTTLQNMKILARPHFQTLETTTALRIPDYHGGEIAESTNIEQIDRVLALRTDRSPRRLLVHGHILEAARDPDASILYFGPSVRDAECMAYMLRASGISSAVVTGNTRDAARREIVADFKEHAVQVLCNCEVLTTGFDAPRVSHVFMARPTVSQVLYEQMVGRGLRGPEFGGTEVCTIVDCKDRISGPKPELGYEAFRKVWGSM